MGTKYTNNTIISVYERFNSFWRVNILSWVIWSPTDYLAEWKFVSGHRKNEKNKLGVEQQPHLAHDHMVNSTSWLLTHHWIKFVQLFFTKFMDISRCHIIGGEVRHDQWIWIRTIQFFATWQHWICWPGAVFFSFVPDITQWQTS